MSVTESFIEIYLCPADVGQHYIVTDHQRVIVSSAIAVLFRAMCWFGDNADCLEIIRTFKNNRTEQLKFDTMIVRHE